MARSIPTLAELVAQRRLAAGFPSINQAVLASQKTKTPVPKGSWVEIENGTIDNPRLATLIGIAATVKCRPSELLEQTAAHAVRDIPVAAIFINPKNVRRTKATEAQVDSMAASVKELGLLQPITVRKMAPDENIKGECFEIVFGETRFRGVVRAFGTKTTIAAQVREISDAELALLMLTENMQRIDMAPLDVADALADASKTRSWEELMAATGRGRRWCQEMVTVGKHLGADAREYLAAGHIKISHAVLLAGVREPGLQATLAVEATKRTEDELRLRIQATRQQAEPPSLPLPLPKTPPRPDPTPPPASGTQPPPDAPPPVPPNAEDGTVAPVPRAAVPLPSAREPRSLGRVGTVTPVARSLEWDTTGALKDGSFHVVILGEGLMVKVIQGGLSWQVLCAVIEQQLPDAAFIHSHLGWSCDALDRPTLGCFGNVMIMRTDDLE